MFVLMPLPSLFSWQSVTQHADLAAIGSQQRGQNADQTRLTRAIRTEKTIRFALRNAERNVVDRPELRRLTEPVSFAKTLAQVPHLNSLVLHDHLEKWTPKGH